MNPESAFLPFSTSLLTPDFTSQWILLMLLGGFQRPRRLIIGNQIHLEKGAEPCFIIGQAQNGFSNNLLSLN